MTCLLHLSNHQTVNAGHAATMTATATARSMTALILLGVGLTVRTVRNATIVR